MIVQIKLNNEVVLVQNNEDLSEVITEFKNLPPETRIGLDTETTGLDFIKDQIVGICLAYKLPTGKFRGFYMPIRHAGTENCPLDRTLKFTRWIIRNRITVLFNRTFDFSMLEQEVFEDGSNFEIKDVRSHDVQIMVYEATSKPMPSLKKSYKDFCKKEVPTFIQTMSKAVSDDEAADMYNFGATDPVLTFPYAAYDPIATLELGETVQRRFPYIKKIYSLDNRVSEVVRQVTKIHTSIDFYEVNKVKASLESQIRLISAECFSITGYNFNLDSSRHKAEALSRFVTLTVKTAKSGALSVNSETLEKIDHPLAHLMVRYAGVKKLLSSYVTNLEKTKGASTRLKYNLCAAPTGRLACGAAKKNSYYMDYNIQSVPKEVLTLYVHRDPNLGLILNEFEEGALGTCETKSGLRRMFNAPEGYCWFTADYSSQELRAVANLANEKVWIDAFKEGRDIHMEVAKLAFNQETREARGHAKSVSFGILYGMSVYSLAIRLGVSNERAQMIVDAYFGALKNIKRWIKHIKSEARKKGVVYTLFGRPRLLEEYYNTSDPKKVAFGDRSAVNSPVQGTGADVLRMTLINLYNWIRDNNLEDAVKICNTVYDEVNFYVRYDLIEKVVKEVPEVMRVKIPNGVDFIVEPGLGTSWGTVIDNPIIKENKLYDSPAIKWYENEKESYHALFSE